jgi:hypothetical protein
MSSITDIQLPEPAGIVVGEERGYSDWFHIIRWSGNHNMPEGTKFFLEEDLHAHAAAVTAAKDVEIVKLKGEMEDQGPYINKFRAEIERLRADAAPAWVAVTQELLNSQEPWLYSPMWIALKDGLVVTGYYEWQQGRCPDRLITNQRGNIAAFNATHVMPVLVPSTPRP